jgi:Mycothiol maleylpyruvate isomerase N-terminal domain
MTNAIRYAYLIAARSVAAFLAAPDVGRAWSAPSALVGFQVSGLAGHLASQVLNVPRVLALPPPVDPPISLLDHYAKASWVDAPYDSATNTEIREGGEEIAAIGPVALAAAVDEAARTLADVLTAQPLDRVVHLPWNGWALTLEDYLTTRLMEIAVHTDDLACSVGATAPELPDEVIAPVFALLTSVAARRHGQAAVLRALSRAERAPATVTAF